MKKIIATLMLFLPGCASQEAYQSYTDTHNMSAAGYYRAAEKPLVDISLPSPVAGQPYHIVLNREVKPMVPEQIKDSEWTGPINGLISAAGMVGGSWAAGAALIDITANSGNSSYSSSKDVTIDNAGDGIVNFTGDTTTTTTSWNQEVGK